MLAHANKHGPDNQFKEGNWVYLKIQIYRQIYMSRKHSSKLFAKYFGPYQTLQKIGNVAYKLYFPSQLLLHPTFHVYLNSNHAMYLQQPFLTLML